LLIQKYFNATPPTREREAQRREYRFDDSFTRVTELICQLRRGNANFFFLNFFVQANAAQAHPDTTAIFLPLFPKGGEGRGEEVNCF